MPSDWPEEIRFYRKYPDQQPWPHNGSKASQGDWRESEAYVPISRLHEISADSDGNQQPLGGGDENAVGNPAREVLVESVKLGGSPSIAATLQDAEVFSTVAEVGQALEQGGGDADAADVEPGLGDESAAVAGGGSGQGAGSAPDPVRAVEWPDVEAGDGRRTERYVLAIEYEVWEEAGISRQELQEAIFEALPLIHPDDNGDEGAHLQQVEVAQLLTQHPSGGQEGGVEEGADEENARLLQEVEYLRDQLRQQVERLEHDLAECYRLTGADPDSDPDWMLAMHAVQEVRELREEADKAGEWEERASVAERHRTTLLGRIDKHNLERSVTSTPQRFSRDSILYSAADQVRKELGERGRKDAHSP